MRRIRGSAGEGDVAALDVVGGEQGREARVGLVALGRDHDAGGVLVQPVHDARPRHPADARQRSGAMEQQGVDQGAIGNAGAVVHGHAGGLVDDDQVGVLVEDVQRDILGLGLGGGGGGHTEQVEPRPGLGRGIAERAAVQGQGALGHQGLQPSPRHLRQLGRQHLVQALAGVLGQDRDREGVAAVVFEFRVGDVVLRGAHGRSTRRPSSQTR